MKKGILTLACSIICFFTLDAQSRLNLDWAGSLGTGQNNLSAPDLMARDGQGNLYVAGVFDGLVDFDPSQDSAMLSAYNFLRLVFLTKYSSNGSVIWAKSIPMSARLTGMAFAPNGELILAGYMNGESDMDPGPGKVIIGQAGILNSFLLSLTDQGAFNWVEWIGEQGGILFRDMAIGGNGNIYVTGTVYNSGDFDPSLGVAQVTSVSGNDAILACYDSQGGFVWVRQMGGSQEESGEHVIVDAHGDVFVAGLFQDETDFDPDTTVLLLTAAFSISDIFVQKFTGQGQFLWVNQLASIYDKELNGIVAAPDGGCWVIGSFETRLNLDRFTPTFLQGGSEHGYLARYRSDGHLAWGKRIEGAVKPAGMVGDGQGGLVTTGSFSGVVDFDPGPGASPQNGLSIDVFLARYDTLGGHDWSFAWGGTQDDQGLALVHVPGAGTVIGASYQAQVDVDPGTGVTSFSTESGMGMAICQYDPGSAFMWGTTTDDFGGQIQSADGIAVDGSGNSYLLGRYDGEVDLDAGPGVALAPRTKAYSNLFLSKLDDDGKFVWGFPLGDTLGIHHYGVHVSCDQDGAVTIVGAFTGTIDLDPSAGTLFITAASSFLEEHFAAKYTAAGTLVWGKKLTDTRVELVGASADSVGNLYLIGKFFGVVDFDPGPGNTATGTASVSNFLQSIDSNGQFRFVKSLGTGPQFYFDRVATDPTGGIWVAGPSYASGDLDPGPATVTVSHGHHFTHYDHLGNFIATRTQPGTPPNTLETKAMAVDAAGNLYFACKAPSGWDFDNGPGSLIVNQTGTAANVLLSYDANGLLRYVNPLGNQPHFDPRALSPAPAGEVWMAATLEDTVDLDPASNAGLFFTARHDREGMLVRFDANGDYAAGEIFATEYGHSDPQAILYDGMGHLYMAGSASGLLDADPIGTHVLPHYGDQDAVWARYRSCTSAASPTYAEPQTPLCYRGAPITLSPGLPTGGTYSGPGVVGNTFTPVLAGIGSFTVTYIVSDLLGCQAAASTTIVVDACSEVAAALDEAAFQLHPNPSTGRLVLTASDWQGTHLDLQLYNAWGQQVHSARLREGDAELQLDHLPAGIYVAALSGRAGKAALRWVKLD